MNKKPAQTGRQCGSAAFKAFVFILSSRFLSSLRPAGRPAGRFRFIILWDGNSVKKGESRSPDSVRQGRARPASQRSARLEKGGPA